MLAGPASSKSVMYVSRLSSAPAPPCVLRAGRAALSWQLRDSWDVPVTVSPVETQITVHSQAQVRGYGQSRVEVSSLFLN